MLFSLPLVLFHQNIQHICQRQGLPLLDVSQVPGLIWIDSKHKYRAIGVERLLVFLPNILVNTTNIQQLDVQLDTQILDLDHLNRLFIFLHDKFCVFVDQSLSFFFIIRQPTNV